ncbi:MAG TPA: hypothetical protein VF656_10730 [Pyrinomonadaceae bacterium]|jgi:hypothetical protein
MKTLRNNIGVNLTLTLALMLACAGIVPAAQDGATPALVVPKGRRFSLELLSPLSTASNQKGDKFSCKILSPAEYAEAIVDGHIKTAKRSGTAKGDSKMELIFDTITLSDGRSGDFNAMVIEVFDVVDAANQGRADNEGLIKAKSTVKRDALKIGAATAAGAIIGGLLGGAKGAALGAAIGASFGVTTTLKTRGPDLEFKAGTQFTVETNAPRKGKANGEGNVAATNSGGRPVLHPAGQGASSEGVTAGSAAGARSLSAPALEPPNASTPTAEEALGAYIKAMGGEDALSRIKSRVLKGEYLATSGNRSFTGALESFEKSPDKSLSILNITNIGTLKEGFDGMTSWATDMRGKVELKGDWLNAYKKRESALISPTSIRRVREAYSQIVMKGVMNVNAEPAYVVELTPALGYPETAYFNTKTGLLVRLDIMYLRGKQYIPTQYLIDDYREVEGVKVPFKYQVLQPGVTSVIKTSEVLFNQAIEDSRFAIPKK